MSESCPGPVHKNSREKDTTQFPSSLAIIQYQGNLTDYIQVRAIRVRMTKPHPVSLIAIGCCVSLISAIGLYMLISDFIFGGRSEYQTPIPFLCAVVVAIPVAIWPARRFAFGWKRIMARSVVFTLLLTPLPYGPEGTLLPLVLTLAIPPLVFPFFFPFHVISSFGTWLGLFSATVGFQMLVVRKERLTHDVV